MSKPPLLEFGAKEYLLGVQHLLAMFGSTVLVPLITGISPAVALFTAGVGTLVFHLLTGGKVPVFLGSSFAFIAALCTVIGDKGIPYAQGGIMAAGAVYIVFAAIAYFMGAARIRSLLPPVVTGPVIIILALRLPGLAQRGHRPGAVPLDAGRHELRPRHPQAHPHPPRHRRRVPHLPRPHGLRTLQHGLHAHRLRHLAQCPLP